MERHPANAGQIARCSCCAQNSFGYFHLPAHPPPHKKTPTSLKFICFTHIYNNHMHLSQPSTSLHVTNRRRTARVCNRSQGPHRWVAGICPDMWVEENACACMLSRFSCVRLFKALRTTARQAPLSMGFSRQESWSGLPRK